MVSLRHANAKLLIKFQLRNLLKSVTIMQNATRTAMIMIFYVILQSHMDN